METTTVSTQPLVRSEPSLGVSSKEKLGMGFWAFTVDMRSHFSGTYRQYFLTNIFHLAPALAGILGMIGSLWNGLNDPFIGYIVHKRRFKSGERIRPYAKFLALPVALLLPLYFLNFHAPVSIKVLFVLALIFFGDIISTFYDIAYTGLPLVMTDKQPERVAINTHISAGAAIGVVLGTLIFWPLLQFFGGVKADGTIIREPRAFLLVSIIVAVISLFGPLVAYYASTERVKAAPLSSNSMPFFQTLKVLAGYRNWTFNVLFEMLYSLNIGFVTSNLLYFTRYVLGNSAAITPLMIAYIVGNVAMLPFIGMINRRLGRKRTMVLGSALLVLSKLVAMINLESFVVVAIHSVIMGAAVSLCIVIFFSNRGDIVDVIAHRFGERLESIVLSFSSMLRKMTASLGALIMGLILQYSGYNAELAIQLDSAVFGIKTLICYLPLGFSILMLFVSLAMTLDRDVAEIRSAL